MLNNYLKIIWRNLRKDRQFTFLNLVGLSAGLTCAFLIYLWVNDELSFDQFHEKDSQLFQVMKNKHGRQGIETTESTPGLLASTLAKEMPEVERAVSVFPQADQTLGGIISAGDTYIKANGKFGSNDYFNIFSYHLIQGNKDQVLAEKNKVVISKELALKLFGTAEKVTGKTIKWDHDEFDGTFLVSGVYDNIPANSSIQFDLLFSYDLCLEVFPNFKNWENGGPGTYVMLKKGTIPTRFNEKIAGLIKSKDKQSNATLFVRKYSERYLYSAYENGIQSGGRIEYVKLFSLIALFILVIACINFMNLSTAKAAGRIREVGIRKSIGTSRVSLIFQYYGESLLMVFIAMIIAIFFVYFLLPQFNLITGKQLSLQFHPGVILSLLLIGLATGFIAGSYPALFLSGFKPAKVLKGKINTTGIEAWTRKGLVVFQFSITIILIVSVLIVSRQTKFIQSKNLGFNKDNIVFFPKEGKLAENDATFLAAAKNIPGVINISGMDGNSDLTGAGDFTSAMDWEGKVPDQKIGFGTFNVGYDLMEILDYRMKEGRSFSRDFGSSNSEIIFNEAAIESMGLKDPVGKTVKLKGKPYHIIGIVKNFNFESLYEKVKPCFFRLTSNARNIVVRIRAGAEQETIEQLRRLYKQHNLGLPFDYKFLDQQYQALYASEQRVSVLSQYFAMLAIIISSLGLFGLAAFTAQKRQKEIGIRKVMGASAGNIAIMLSGDFLRLVLMAVLVAFPLSWWAMNEWLRDFEYRVDVGVDVFLIAGIATILITFLTISFQSIKAAVARPVESLRME